MNQKINEINIFLEKNYLIVESRKSNEKQFNSMIKEIDDMFNYALTKICDAKREDFFLFLKSNFTNSQVSSCGFDKAQVSRYFSGENHPNDHQFLKMLKGLDFSKTSKDIFVGLYYWCSARKRSVVYNAVLIKSYFETDNPDFDIVLKELKK